MICYSQMPTPTDRLRAPASPEFSRPPPLSTGFGPACSVTPLPLPQAKKGETSRSIKPREPSYRWHLMVSRRFYETPRARHALLTSCFPSKPVTPLLKNRKEILLSIISSNFPHFLLDSHKCFQIKSAIARMLSCLSHFKKNSVAHDFLYALWYTCRAIYWKC